MGLMLITVVLPFYGWTALHFSFGLLALISFGMLLKYKDHHYERIQALNEAHTIASSIPLAKDRPKFNGALLDSKIVRFGDEEVEKYFRDNPRDD